MGDREKEMNPGEVIEVFSHDMGIKEDMPNWCKGTGNECLGIHQKRAISSIC